MILNYIKQNPRLKYICVSMISLLIFTIMYIFYLTNIELKRVISLDINGDQWEEVTYYKNSLYLYDTIRINSDKEVLVKVVEHRILSDDKEFIHLVSPNEPFGSPDGIQIDGGNNFTVYAKCNDNTNALNTNLTVSLSQY